mgnify:CR=1 FL=1
MRPDLPERLSALRSADTPPKLHRLIEREVVPALRELRAIDDDTVMIPRMSLDRPASEQGLGSDADAG